MMVLITKLTHQKWHLRLPVLWHLRMLLRKLTQSSLEPMMKVTVIVPEEYMGDVIGDLNSRRGLIQRYGRQ